MLNDAMLCITCFCRHFPIVGLSSVRKRFYPDRFYVSTKIFFKGRDFRGKELSNHTRISQILCAYKYEHTSTQYLKNANNIA